MILYHILNECDKGHIILPWNKSPDKGCDGSDVSNYIILIGGIWKQCLRLTLQFDI